VDWVQLDVRLDAPLVKDLVSTGMRSGDIDLVWDDEWHGFAERGSRIRRFLLFGWESLLYRVRVEVDVMPKPSGHTVLEFKRATLMRLGTRRTRRLLRRLRRQFETAFETEGVLIGVRDG
jgi:hypothetical protein